MAQEETSSYCLQALICFLVLTPMLGNADTHYTNNWTVWNNEAKHPLKLINKEGLTGRWAGLRANRPYDNLDFEVWFVNSTFNSYTLSVILLELPKSWNNPSLDARIIWTANRGNPVGENASFSFTSIGNLELKDERGRLVWSSYTYSKGVQTLLVTNMGNLVLQTRFNDTIWENFDELTDTLMVGRVLKPAKNLTSWASTTDSSVGGYSLVMEPGGLVLYSSIGDQKLPYWIWSPSGQQDLDAIKQSATQMFAAFCIDSYSDSDFLGNLQLGSNFSAVDNTNMLNDFACKHIGSSGQRQDFGHFNSAGTFLKILPDGNLKVYSWNITASSWSELFSLFDDQNSCSLPNKCGSYRLCRNGKCGECLAGHGSFVEINKSQPYLGCKPVNSTCSLKFAELKGYEYFTVKYQSKNLVSKQACQDACRGDCNCKAAFYNFSASSCFLMNNTVGTVQAVSDNNLLAFVRLGSIHRSVNWKAIAGGTVGGLLFIVVVISVLYKISKPKKSSVSSEDDEAVLVDDTLKAMLPTKFSFEELRIITEDFSQPIGFGAFGQVYRGKLIDGTEVAVKKLEKLEADHKEFYTEIAILGKSYHQNLVRLLGYCATATKSILVYEFMKNSSLDRWLFGDKPRLTWRQRFDIIVGTAKGLAYLHEECSDKIIHLDLKPQNILLDSELRPKIADFGVSKLVSRDQSLVMTRMRGTPGYLAPEWLIEGVVTEKADVYGYGVVAFEILSGKRIRECLSSIFNYHYLQKDGNNSFQDLIDSGIADCVDNEEAERVVKVASLCIQDNPIIRPSMSKVVQMLEAVVPIPGQCLINVQARLAFTSQMDTGISISSSFTP